MNLNLEGQLSMDYLELSEEFLQDAQNFMSYDADIPFHYRILGKLNFNDDFYNAKRFIEANEELFNDEYAYLVLDSAVEMCLSVVTDENGVVYNTSNLPKGHIYKPSQFEMDYIEYLLQKRANPLLPKHFNQYEHIKDLEDDCSNQAGVIFDLSD